mgnify:FL=1
MRLFWVIFKHCYQKKSIFCNNLSNQNRKHVFKKRHLTNMFHIFYFTPIVKNETFLSEFQTLQEVQMHTWIILRVEVSNYFSENPDLLFFVQSSNSLMSVNYRKNCLWWLHFLLLIVLLQIANFHVSYILERSEWRIDYMLVHDHHASLSGQTDCLPGNHLDHINNCMIHVRLSLKFFSKEQKNLPYIQSFSCSPIFLIAFRI